MRLYAAQHASGGHVTAMTTALALVAVCGVAVFSGGPVGRTAYAATGADGSAVGGPHLPVSLLAPTGTPSSSPAVSASPTAAVPHSGTPRPSASASGSVAPHAPRTASTATPSASPAPGSAAAAMIGSSTGGSVTDTQTAFPNMDVVRFYYPGTPSEWGGSIATIRSDRTIFVSFKYDVATTAAGGSDVAFTQVLRSWAASGRQIYWTWQHEADNPSKGISQAAYRAGWDHLLADAAAVPAANLHSMSILMGVALTGSHGPVEGWYVPGVDVLGFDSYYLGTEKLAEQYAAAKHKPLAFPEFGASINGSPDPTSVAFATDFLATLDGNTIAAVWFNNYGNNLSTHPQTLSVLRAAAG